MRPIIRKAELDLILPLDGISSMLELGNKRFGKNNPFAWKHYFEQRGIRHVSIDMNGLDGALPLDLRKPLWDRLGTFDSVTNFGTTEHVSQQEPVWRNICAMCERLFISATPRPGSYAGHGLWYPKPEFYEELARLNGFKVERLYIWEKKSHQHVVMCRMSRDGVSPFVMPDASLLSREGDADSYSEMIAGKS